MNNVSSLYTPDLPKSVDQFSSGLVLKGLVF